MRVGRVANGVAHLGHVWSYGVLEVASSSPGTVVGRVFNPNRQPVRFSDPNMLLFPNYEFIYNIIVLVEKQAVCVDLLLPLRYTTASAAECPPRPPCCSPARVVWLRVAFLPSRSPVVRWITSMWVRPTGARRCCMSRSPFLVPRSL